MGHLGIFGGGILPGMMGQFPGVKPLFSDAEEIIQWVRDKRIYPIIHLVAVREALLERYPDLAPKLLSAFREAKDFSVRYMIPDLIASLERENEILGEDPYAYQLGAMEKRTLEALMRYQIEQGLMRNSLFVEGLFVGEAKN